MYGEGIREAGILVAVFGPMYVKFETHAEGWALVQDMLVWFISGIAAFVVGVEMDRRRK